MSNSTGLIYIHTNTKSGKSYIGYTTKTLEKRFKGHIRDAYNGSKFHFHNAIRIYGKDSWNSKTLEENIPTDIIGDRETYWIAEYDTYNKGYNMTKGGKGGKVGTIPWNKGKVGTIPWNKGKVGVYSEESKRRMSEGQKGRISPMRGKTFPAAWKKKLSEAHKGKVLSEEHKQNLSKPVLQYYKSGEFVREFCSGKKAAVMTNTDVTGICQCCQGKLKTSGGYIWKYKSS